MDCKILRSRLIEELMAANAGPPSEAVRNHLAECPRCRALRDLWLGLGGLPAQTPDPDLGLRFRQRLEQPPESRNGRGWLLPLAAAAVLLAGIALGARLGQPSKSWPRTPSENVYAALRNNTPSKRIQAIAALGPTSNGKDGLVDALLERVHQDPNLPVRLSAVEALYLFGGEPGLVPRLEASLRQQDQPQVQLALVDLLAALRERRAAEALHRLLKEGRLEPEVRDRAQSRLIEIRL